MKYMKTGLTQIDEALGGLKYGETYFISASDRNAGRGFAASLCASVSSSDTYQALFITDTPIPYCCCEHIHFVDTKAMIEFLRVVLDGDAAYEMPKTDLYVIDGFDLLFWGSNQKWPCDSSLQKHLYEVYLYAIKKLAEEFDVTVILIDQLLSSNDDYDDSYCDFPDVRGRVSGGSFMLRSEKNDALTVRYINHQYHISNKFQFISTPKKLVQMFPFYDEYK